MKKKTLTKDAFIQFIASTLDANGEILFKAAWAQVQMKKEIEYALLMLSYLIGKEEATFKMKVVCEAAYSNENIINKPKYILDYLRKKIKAEAGRGSNVRLDVYQTEPNVITSEHLEILAIQSKEATQ